MTLEQALTQLQARCQSRGYPDSAATHLLCHTLNCSSVAVYTDKDRLLGHAEQEKILALLEQLNDDVPVAYILGEQPFMDAMLTVNASVLVPRSETEAFVPLLQQWFSGAPETLSILDCGTGSGAIAIAVAMAFPQAQVSALDNSEAALDVARANAQRNHCSDIHFFHSDWFSSLPAQPFDAIVSNPPYIETTDPHLTDGIKHEPLQALVSGEDGLQAIRNLTAQASDYLVSGGLLAIEHGYQQGEAVRGLLLENGFEQVRTEVDFQDLDRISLGVWNNSSV